MTLCPCGSNSNYENCCERIHNKLQVAKTPEQLMRARYSAFAYQLIDFIYYTFHPSTRSKQNKSDIAEWARLNKWLKLEIVSSKENIVEFKAYYLNSQYEMEIHHEISTFKKDAGNWFYVTGEYPK